MSNSVSSSSNTSESTSESETTSIGKDVIRIAIGKCLRQDFNILVGGTPLIIPATVPSGLPWGEWVEVARTSEHWKMGVWVEETVEVYLPEL
jgi:hypothetical protein